MRNDDGSMTTRRRLGLAALVAPLLLGGGAARAQTSVPGALSLDGAATLVSDYRFRGLSRSDRDPAVQATATLSHRSGAYAGLWTSTIGDDVASGGDPEIDLYGGFRRALGGTTADVGLLYYAYPGTRRAHAASFEPYASVAHTLGPVTGKLGVHYGWAQRALALGDEGRRSGLYGYGELSSGIPGTPLTLTGHLGRAFRANAMTFGQRYTDWSLQLAYVRRRLTLSAAYVDTDAAIRPYPADPHGRDIAGAGLVGAIGLSF